MRRVAASLLVLAAGLATVDHSVSAGTTERGARIDVEVSLDGFATPAKYWQDPCADDEPYTKYWVGTPVAGEIFRDATLDITTAQLSNEMGRGYVESTYGPDVVNQVVWAESMYIRQCMDPDTAEVDASSWEIFWVPLVSMETVVPALYKHLWDYLHGPTVSWPSMDQDFGWLYVNAPMDFRVDPLPAISLTATVTNVTGSVTATVSATPAEVTLEPGEPGGRTTSCSLAAATAAYLPSTPGSCSYTYNNSSALEPSEAFDVGAMVRWVVDTSDATFPVQEARTWSWSDVAVAEVQAVVTG